MKRKNIRTVLVMMFVLACSIFPYAAERGWVQEGDYWIYLNSKGERVQEQWKLNDSGSHKFWLGEDGKMAVSELLDIDGKYYYVNEDGAQVKEEWRLCQDDEGEERWYYFDASGKAYSSGWKSIGNKRYHFTDSMMDYGYLSEEGEMLEGDDSDVWKEALYFVGDDGARKEKTWLQIDDFDTDEYDTEELWIFFGTNGKKITNKVQMINGKRYAFDAQGAMMNTWFGTATPTDSSYKYYNEEGEQQRSGWFTAVPSEDQDSDDHDDEKERRYYANKSGVTYKNGIKTINGRKYVFDQYGIMRTGLIVIDSSKKIVEILAEDAEDFPSAADVKAARSKGDLILTDEDGVIRTGKVTVELDGDDYTMQFNKTGIAKHGALDGYLYDNGIMIKVEKGDSDYKYMIYSLEGKDYLVDTSGRIKKAGSYNDNDDVRWVVTENKEKGGYNIQKTLKKN